MIAAYHLVWTAYGWWLPNDPRGSMSREVRTAAIASLGELHYGRKRVLPAYQKTRTFYESARTILKHELLTFEIADSAAIGGAFAEVIRHRRYTCYACAIMPDHVHVVIRKHGDQAEEMIERLQVASRDAILDLAARPQEHPVWGGPGWKVFLETSDDIERTIEYVRQNPIKTRRPPQVWPFVMAYDGWLPGLAKPQAGRRGR